MKRMMTLMGLVICSINLFAQVTISGKVKDNKGRPLSGASVALKGTYDGAVVDSLSNYKFTTTEKGDQVLSITMSGYKSFEQKITIGQSPIVVDASLKEELNELKAVTVTAGAFAASDAKKAATVLTPLDIVT